MDTIVILSSVHWAFTWQRHHDIATGLAKKGYQVIFVQPLPKRIPTWGEWRRVWARISGRVDGAGYGQQTVPNSIKLLSPHLLPDVGAIWQGINRWGFVPHLSRQIRKLAAHGRLIVWNYLPTSASLALQRWLHPQLAIYDCVWDWAADPFSKGLEQWEKKLVGEADWIFADSPYLYEKMATQSSRVTQLLPAVHYDLFRPSQSDLPPSNPPRCAYFGDIGVNVDVELLQQVSQHYPLRLIGTLRVAKQGFSEQTEFVGAVAHEQLPALLQDVDILLLPYRQAPHVPAVIPAKTFECLATGKPTVVWGLSSLQSFAGLFYLCRQRSDFLPTIAQTIHEPAHLRQARIQFAQANDWSARIHTIDQQLQTLLATQVNE